MVCKDCEYYRMPEPNGHAAKRRTQYDELSSLAESQARLTDNMTYGPEQLRRAQITPRNDNLVRRTAVPPESDMLQKASRHQKILMIPSDDMTNRLDLDCVGTRIGFPLPGLEMPTIFGSCTGTQSKEFPYRRRHAKNDDSSFLWSSPCNHFVLHLCHCEICFPHGHCTCIRKGKPDIRRCNKCARLLPRPIYKTCPHDHF